MIRAETLAGVPHGFLGRRGGVSTGELAGLNVGYGSNDDRAAIDENRVGLSPRCFQGPSLRQCTRSIPPRSST